MSIQIQVRDKVAVNLTPEKVIVCGNSGYEVEFLFDDEWASEAVKTARFVYRKGGQNYFDDVVFSGTTVKAPVLSNINYVLVGVYAGDIITTTPAAVECDKSILCGSGMHEDPTPDVYNQLVELINSVGVTDEQIASAVEGYLEENPVEGGATAEQAAQITQNKTDIANLQKNAFSGNYEDLTGKPVIPSALPNPNKLTFTGAVTAEYDGSTPVSVEIPSGGGNGENTSTNWQIVARVITSELVSRIALTTDLEGNSLSLDDCIIQCIAAPNSELSAKSDSSIWLNNTGFAYPKGNVYLDSYYTTYTAIMSKRNNIILYPQKNDAWTYTSNNNDANLLHGGSWMGNNSAYIPKVLDLTSATSWCPVTKVEFVCTSGNFGIGSQIVVWGIT